MATLLILYNFNPDIDMLTAHESEAYFVEGLADFWSSVHFEADDLTNHSTEIGDDLELSWQQSYDLVSCNGYVYSIEKDKIYAGVEVIKHNQQKLFIFIQ